MRTLAKTSTRPNYLFALLPHYFKEYDSYKDVNGEGLLERYLEVFCQEVDGNISPFIDKAHYLYDAESLSLLPHSNPDAFLDHLAKTFGDPPYIGTDSEYRSLIRYIIHILLTKGTTQSVSLFLAIYGYKIYMVTESSVSSMKYDSDPVLQHDMGGFYDLGFNFYSGWGLMITDIPGTGNKFPSSIWLDKLRQAIQKFIAPIFATLGQISYSPYTASQGVATVTGTLTAI